MSCPRSQLKTNAVKAASSALKGGGSKLTGEKGSNMDDFKCNW